MNGVKQARSYGQTALQSIYMATNIVNLDAMIKREDFAATSPAGDYEKTDTIALSTLGPGQTFFSTALRKPDFQRETSGWSPNQIADLVFSFVSGDLVPAVILWKPSDSQYLFVIDGAHRLSALMAWINDDYGDGLISLGQSTKISYEQERAAVKTRQVVKAKVGSYADHDKAIRFPATMSANILAQAERLSSLALRVQWVPGNAEKAEKSFFKINQSATPIDETELKILRARTLPAAISSRAIMRGGTGHQYWKDFTEEYKKGIVSLSAASHKLLFQPPLITPIKTLDLPIAGSPNLSLIFDFVNLVNNEISQVPAQQKRIAKNMELTEEEKLKIDTDGRKTMKYLENARDVAQQLTGLHPSSLGLHPAIYFYSATGRHQLTAFLATIGFVRELTQKNRLVEFTKHRNAFEEFLLAHKDFINQTVKKLGAGFRPYYRLKDYYHFILDRLKNGSDDVDILEALENDARFSFLKEIPFTEDADTKTPSFKSAVKSAVFLKAALDAPRERCFICHARIHVSSISIDHIVKREDGGLGIANNGQISHPYCNSIKTKLDGDL